MTQSKVSIIVPIYGVEKYLHQCVDSILAQTLKEIEIILVDDGSKDNCPAIVDEYAKKDPRVVAIHQENGGYGKAVNHGLKVATGEYIGIVESDDFIEPDMFEELYNLATTHNVDVVKSNFHFYWSTKPHLNKIKSLFSQDYYGKVVEPQKDFNIFKVMPCIWSAIYKRDFVTKNNLRLLETAGASYQDTSFAFKIWATAKKIYLTEKAYLHYRQDNESSSINNKAKIFCVKDEYDEMERFLKERKMEDYIPLLWRLKFDTYHWNLKRVAYEFKEEFFKTFYNEFKKANQQGLLKENLFDEEWKKVIKLLNTPQKFLSKYLENTTRIKLFNKLTILKIREKNKKKKYYFCGIRIF